MAGTTGVDLDDRNVKCSDAIRIERILNVAFNDGDSIFVSEGNDGLLHKRRFTRARRTHQVDDKHFMPVENFSVFFGNTIVGV